MILRRNITMIKLCGSMFECETAAKVRVDRLVGGSLAGSLAGAVVLKPGVTTDESLVGPSK